MSRMMMVLLLVFGFHVPFLASCGDAGRFTFTDQDQESDGVSSQSAPISGTGAVTVESCTGDPLSCIKNVDRRVYSKEELPRELWCWYGYPGADEYCKVKVNEKAFHKN